MGDAAYLADQLKLARTHYTKARQLAPKDPAPQVGLLRVALAGTGVATDYAIAPKNAKVRALVRQADAIIKLAPDFGPAHVEKGRLLLILGDADQALQALHRGVELSPQDPEAHSALGVALLALGKTAEALSSFERAVELDRASADRLTNLGTAYMLRGKVDQAITAYERAVRLSPNDPRARGDLGTAYLSANRAKEAMVELKRAVALDPRATFLSNLGYAYQLGGDLKLAVATYRQALKADPKLGSAWINLGTALAKQGELAEAEKAFKAALKLDPTDPRAKANLAELEELRQKK